MSISEHMKAKKVLEMVLSGDIKSYEETVNAMGKEPFYKLWAKNIWEYHTTEAPSVDLKVRLPSKLPKKTTWKILCNETDNLFLVETYTLEEAICIVRKHLNDDETKNLSFKELDDTFKRQEIKLKV